MTLKDSRILEQGNVLCLRWDIKLWPISLLSFLLKWFIRMQKKWNFLCFSASSQHGALPAAYGQHYDQKSIHSAGPSEQRRLLWGTQWGLLRQHFDHTHNSDLSCWNPSGPQLSDNSLHCPIRRIHVCQRAKETQGAGCFHVHSRQWQSVHCW